MTLTTSLPITQSQQEEVTCLRSHMNSQARIGTQLVWLSHFSKGRRDLVLVGRFSFWNGRAEGKADKHLPKWDWAGNTKQLSSVYMSRPFEEVSRRLIPSGAWVKKKTVQPKTAHESRPLQGCPDLVSLMLELTFHIPSFPRLPF